MKTILIIGAGRSATSLIDYLINYTAEKGFQITIGDVNIDFIKEKTSGDKNVRCISFDINNENQRHLEISQSDVIISMLPAHLHLNVAKDCITYKKHLITASYVSEEMKSLHTEALKHNLLFLNECGLDPGIDHMSAMKIIDELKSEDAEIDSFHSYCGGLVAPKFDTNPWGYKFSWNPRNVVLAGQGTARYIADGKLKFLPYNRLFAESKTVTVENFGNYDAYANRDSISYRQPYGLENISEIIRGTLRMPGYCEAWNIFVQLGLTDDSYVFPAIKGMTYRDLMNSFLPGTGKVEDRLLQMIPDKNPKIYEKFEWLGILNTIPLPEGKLSPAALLQALLEEKWKLQTGDCDRIVMKHEFIGKIKNNKFAVHSSLVVDGDDEKNTAMSKTVGLPMAIACKLLLEDKIKERGVVIPVTKEFYLPILSELETLGIIFHEKKIDLK